MVIVVHLRVWQNKTLPWLEPWHSPQGSATESSNGVPWMTGSQGLGGWDDAGNQELYPKTQNDSRFSLGRKRCTCGRCHVSPMKCGHVSCHKS